MASRPPAAFSLPSNGCETGGAELTGLCRRVGVNLGWYCRQRAPGCSTVETMRLKRSMLRDSLLIGLQGRIRSQDQLGHMWSLDL